jgi:hypothetical protein
MGLWPYTLHLISCTLSLDPDALPESLAFEIKLNG